MNAEDAKGPPTRNHTLLIIVVAILLFAVLLLCFNDRQHKRDLELRRLETRVDALEDQEWSGENVRPGRGPGTGGTVL